MKAASVVFLIVLGILLGSAWAAPQGEHHVNAKLEPVGGSGVTGQVSVTQLPGGGTQITIHAEGLTPGEEYLSLYYENSTCEVEKYDEDDVLGHYTANRAGKATISVKAADDLDEIHSISVRLDADFSLLSCAEIQARE